MGRSTARVLVADSRWLYSEAISAALERQYQVWAVADLGSMAQILPEIDLLIIADEVAAQNNFEPVRLARAAQPGLKLLIISELGARDILRQYREFDVSGFLSRDCGIRDFTQAVTAVLNGQPYSARLQAGAAAPNNRALTGRQAEVLRLVSEGLSAKEIAHRLHVSQRTVEFHKANIMRLLGLRSSPEMIRFVMESHSEPAPRPGKKRKHE